VKHSKVLFILTGITLFSGSLAGGIVVDHTCTDVSKIPLSYLDSVRELDILFYHRFIGDSILLGFDDLIAEDPLRYEIEIIRDMNIGWFVENNGIGHRAFGGFYPDNKCVIFNEFMREEHFSDVADIAFFKFSVEDFVYKSWWCDIPADSIWFTFYKPTMEALERDFPEVAFVWWTAPLSDRWGNEEKEVYNTLVRNYCTNSDKILFDLADIESHDTLGQPVRDVDGFEALFPGYGDDGTLLNDLGQRIIASGLWWLFAEIVGWNGSVTEKVVPDRLVLNVDLVAGLIRYKLPSAGYVELCIYDASGREVVRMVNGIKTPGEYSISLDRLSTGIYFCILEGYGQVTTGKIIVID